MDRKEMVQFMFEQVAQWRIFAHRCITLMIKDAPLNTTYWLIHQFEQFLYSHLSWMGHKMGLTYQNGLNFVI
jgi:hypothetical protein